MMRTQGCTNPAPKKRCQLRFMSEWDGGEDEEEKRQREKKEV